jgi:hypothetical protein
MGNFGHRQIGITSTTAPIAPEDFKSNLHRKEAWGKFSEWNAGPMRHVIEALGGTPVVIVMDKRTGFTLVGAVLVDVRSRRSGGQGIAVSTECAKTPQNPQGITVYPLRSVGLVIPLQSTTHGQGRAAVQAESRELELAERIYRESLPAERPEGRVEVTSHGNEIHAGYRRTSYADRLPTPNWARITLEQVQEASLCDTCLKTRETESHQYKCPTFQVEMDARLEAERQRREADRKAQEEYLERRRARHGF